MRQHGEASEPMESLLKTHRNPERTSGIQCGTATMAKTLAMARCTCNVVGDRTACFGRPKTTPGQPFQPETASGKACMALIDPSGLSTPTAVHTLAVLAH